MRNELDRLRVEVLQRRLYMILEPVVLAVEDTELRVEVVRDVWEALGRQAERMASDEYRKGNP